MVALVIVSDIWALTCVCTWIRVSGTCQRQEAFTDRIWIHHETDLLYEVVTCGAPAFEMNDHVERLWAKRQQPLRFLLQIRAILIQTIISKIIEITVYFDIKGALARHYDECTVGIVGNSNQYPKFTLYTSNYAK